VAAAAENGLLRLVRGRHTDQFLDELTAFPHGKHDDCVDALAGAHNHVSKLPRGGRRSSVPRGRIPSVDRRAGRDPYSTRRTGRDPLEQVAWTLGARFYDNPRR
ncbi:MAG: hypothetical protein ACJ77E_00740, partial [Gaiellaceae bacterium]